MNPRALLVSLLALAPTAAGQFATSPGFQLTAFEVGGGGQGQSSLGRAGIVALPPLAGAQMFSGSYQAEVGFLAVVDSLASQDPVVFGVQPRHVSLLGGDAITIFGRNFGAMPQVRIGGVLATGLSVLSPTVLTCLTSPLPEGPQSVEITVNTVAGRLAEAVLVLPALLVTRAPVIGARADFVCVGPEGGLFDLYYSLTSLPLATPIGQLLVDPFNLNPVLIGVPYPAPDGVFSLSLDLPPDPALHGITIHLQALAYHPVLPPSGIHLSNGVTVTVQ